MSDLAVIDQPQHPIAKPDRAVQITGKVRVAIDAMVWEGLPRKEAAIRAGISEHGLYKAFRKAPVRQHYLNELEVLRTSERARNIHALAEVRDGTNQMARVAAVKALEQLSEETQGRSGASVASPGLTVMIINGPVAPRETQIKEIDQS